MLHQQPGVFSHRFSFRIDVIRDHRRRLVVRVRGHRARSTPDDLCLNRAFNVDFE